MTDNDYASKIYCCVFNVDSDGGDSYTRGILDAVGTLTIREQAALESYYRYGNTYKHTGIILGKISGEAARRIVQKALLKLRHQSRIKNMSVASIIKNREKKIADVKEIADELRITLDHFLKKLSAI